MLFLSESVILLLQPALRIKESMASNGVQPETQANMDKNRKHNGLPHPPVFHRKELGIGKSIQISKAECNILNILIDQIYL